MHAEIREAFTIERSVISLSVYYFASHHRCALRLKITKVSQV